MHVETVHYASSCTLKIHTPSRVWYRAETTAGDAGDMSKTSEDQQLELLPSTPQLLKKSRKVAQFAERLAEQETTKARSEALVFARTIAMAGLPKRPTDAKMLSRTLRLGSDLWLEVSYHTDEDKQLPYGEDRFVLAALQHLAIERDSPVVLFSHVGSLLEMFDFGRSGRDFQRLRERFERLANFSIRLVFASTEEGLKEAPGGQRRYVVDEWALPTKKELAEADDQQLALPLGIEDAPERAFGVRLSTSFWEHLKEKEHHLIAPVELLKLFIDCPVGWDYLCFLIARCGRAKTSTVIDHEILMGLFKEERNTEPDRNTIRRLRKYHELIMQATRGNLKATIEEAGYLPRKPGQKGRSQKRWILKIHPSAPIVFSGKKIEALK